MLYSYITIEMNTYMHGRLHIDVASNVITLQQVHMHTLYRLEQKAEFS